MSKQRDDEDHTLDLYLVLYLIVNLTKLKPTFS